MHFCKQNLHLCGEIPIEGGLPLDQEPGSFIQVKSHKRFDGLNMLGWGQKSIFHVAAGSHPVRVARVLKNRGPKNAFILVKSHKDKTCSISIPGGYLW